MASSATFAIAFHCSYTVRAFVDGEIPMAIGDLRKMGVEALLKLRSDIESALGDRRRQLEKQLEHLGLFGRTAGKRGRKPGSVNKTHALKGTKRPAKYRDPESGKTWAGVGMLPRWLAAYEAKGMSREQFATGATNSSAPARASKARKKSKTGKRRGAKRAKAA
jgi:DNA-binding protein H-NS